MRVQNAIGPFLAWDVPVYCTRCAQDPLTTPSMRSFYFTRVPLRVVNQRVVSPYGARFMEMGCNMGSKESSAVYIYYYCTTRKYRGSINGSMWDDSAMGFQMTTLLSWCVVVEKWYCAKMEFSLQMVNTCRLYLKCFSRSIHEGKNVSFLWRRTHRVSMTGMACTAFGRCWRLFL